MVQMSTGWCFAFDGPLMIILTMFSEGAWKRHMMGLRKLQIDEIFVDGL